MTAARTVCLTVLGAVFLGAQQTTAQDLRVGGFVRLDRRFTLTDSVQLVDFFNVFRPELSASFEGRADVVVSIDMRFYDFTRVRSTDELENPNRHLPSSVTVWEAFARSSGFLVESLDLTVGRQRIQWGVADGLNPTDRFNTYDLSDLTDFTARIPVWAVRGEYYISPDWRMEAVWTPTAHGPVLSPGMEDLFASAGNGAPPVPVASREGHFEPPPPRPGNGQYGLKVAGNATGLDFSASYFDGFDGIPVVRAMTFMSPDTLTSHPTYDAHVWSVLPRVQQLGADVATEWRGIGLWAEGAVILPQEVETVTDVITGSDSTRNQVRAIEGQPYATWTVGGDYRFRGGWYFNLQWAHGLFLERGAGQLHDYLFGKLEHRLPRETVTVSLQGVVEVAQWTNWSNHTGYGVYPEIEYSPVDNIDVSIGGLWAGGRDETLFGRLDFVDQLYLKVNASF